MSTRPVGPVVSLPTAQRPSRISLQGRTVHLVPLHPDHAIDLFPHVGGDEAKSTWDYMSDGPFNDLTSFQAAIAEKSTSTDPFYFAVIDGRGHAVGYLSLMNITPQHLTVEIGNVLFSSALQRTTPATETFYLLLRYVMDLGYRRVEWKCNALNAPSRRAALRLGFTFEGIFRQHMVIKGRSRDTAWFSLLREEWGGVREGFEKWLEESNFDGGRQRMKLEEFRK